MNPTRAAVLPFICLLGAMVLWATSYIALKIAFRTYDPMLVIFGRMAIASLLCLIFIRRLLPVPYRAGDFKALAFMVFCEPCLYFLFEGMALNNTSASQAGMITSLLPLTVAVAARLVLNEKLSPRTLAGFIIALAGAAWLSYAGASTESAPNPALGNLYEFIAMICATGYIITMKHLTFRYSPFFLTALQAFSGSLFFLPVYAFTSGELPQAFDPVGVLAIVYLGSFVTLGAYGLYNFATSRIPASQAAAFINLIPALTVILGWLLLHERFTVPQYGAAVLVFAGVYLSQRRRRYKRPADGAAGGIKQRRAT